MCVSETTSLLKSANYEQDLRNNATKETKGQENGEKVESYFLGRVGKWCFFHWPKVIPEPCQLS